MNVKRSLLEAIRGPGWAPGRGAAEGRMPSLDGATEWLNSPPLATDGLRGRVVIVDFWTYTCINWLRTVPYVRAWAEAYRNAGAVVLGVHTPEFPFERDADNVRRAIHDRQITYPVAVDSDYAVWTAFANMYWPALYVVDAQGYIRYHHFGEGAYEESEQVIRQLLGEAGAGDTVPAPIPVDPRGIEPPPDGTDLRSAENYLVSDRTENFAPPEAAATGIPRRYTTRPGLALNHWALSGEWTVQPDAVLSGEPGGRIACRFSARDVHLVVAPAAPGAPVRVGVRIDGRPPARAHGAVVAADGTGAVTEPRLYQLIRQRGPVAEHTFEITFLDPGAQAYAFTFG